MLDDDPRLEQEHAWREILQIQLGNHWLSLYFPEEKRILRVTQAEPTTAPGGASPGLGVNAPVLEKIRGSEGRAA